MERNRQSRRNRLGESRRAYCAGKDSRFNENMTLSNAEKISHPVTIQVKEAVKIQCESGATYLLDAGDIITYKG
jgi:hypothetical protein